MNLATLRVEGSDKSLGELKALLDLSPDVEWHAGERRRNGAIRDLSGFNFSIANAETADQMTNLLKSFLSRCAAAGVRFPWRGITGEVDIGFSVGDSVRFFGGFRLSAADIEAFAECGLALCATAYPTSDEGGASQQETRLPVEPRR